MPLGEPENPVTLSEQDLPEGRPRHHHPDEASMIARAASAAGAPSHQPCATHTAAAPAALIVCTRDTAGPTPRANEDELFALAGSRPAALHRLPDGSERWIWLDEKRPF